MPRRVCESLPATRDLAAGSASDSAVWFCVGRREPLRVSMPSIQGISAAMCGAVICAVDARRDVVQLVKMRWLCRYGSSSRDVASQPMDLANCASVMPSTLR